MKKLLMTRNDPALLVLRLVLGGVFFMHGAQKALGWFGGRGLSATLEGFTKHMGLSMTVALLVVAAEFFGPIGLVLGFLTRIAAAGIFAVMVGAVAMVHWQHGFFMNWFGKQSGEGYEYHLLAMAMALALTIGGGGMASVDGSLARR